MCGIFCCLVPQSNGVDDHRLRALTSTVVTRLKRRGPDCLSERNLVVEARGQHETFHLCFIGTVLHLRGVLTLQPICDDEGNVLLWNGEIFDGIEVEEGRNDGMVLLETLVNKATCCPTQHILNTFSAVRGPWAFIFWQAQEKKLWLGRDYFGRRSLLWHLPSSPADLFAVTSVMCRPQCEEDMRWVEVPADGIYCVHMSTSPECSNSNEDTNYLTDRLQHFCWSSSVTATASGRCLRSPVEAAFNRALPTDKDLESQGKDIQELNPNCTKGTDSINEQAVDVAVFNSSEVKETDAVNTPSNKTDSMQSISGNTMILVEPPATSIASATAALTMREDLVVAELNEPREMVDNVSIHEKSDVASCETRCGSSNIDTTDSIPQRLISVLGQAVRKRVLNLPRRVDGGYFDVQCKALTAEGELGGDSLSAGLCNQNTIARLSSQETDRPAEVGILFSGGIDSMVIAALADRFVPGEEPIDLINVAFGQKPRDECSQITNKKNRRASKKVTISRTPTSQHVKLNYEVPDRITGKNGLKELSQLNKTRQWRFVEVNVEVEELKSMRSRHISHLVSPLDTVLDDSIGCALWFAARGSGILRCPSCVGGDVESDNACCHQMKYTSKAKVLLVGMGADEQLGGYARHRTRFSQEGWTGLIDEIEMEVGRISKRNLGRDDRCISDHGREARFPFLDEHVVSLLNGLPVWVKTDPRFPRGVGEKRLLRRAARLLGLTSSSTLPKRAIQFGSRIAKLESAGEKGSQTCSRLTLD